MNAALAAGIGNRAASWHLTMRLSMAETVKIAQKGSYGYRYGHEKGLFDGVSYTLDRDGKVFETTRWS